MRKDKENALELRKLGKSYLDIEKQLGVPKSTLSDWFRGQSWSKEISAKLLEKAKPFHRARIQELNKIRGEHLKKLYEQADKEAIEEFELLKYHPLFVAGLMIYWGEGNKVSKSRCWIANTEPLMIKLFLQFLRNICGFNNSRIKAWILIYPDLDEKLCKSFWIGKTSLPVESFNKSTMIAGKHKTNRLSFGVCSVGVSSAYLKCKILKWIELLAKDLVQENYIAGMV
ncbi:MAG: hypothetical protein WC269_04945 [Candidatus Gracilibacteria bacterium]